MDNTFTGTELGKAFDAGAQAQFEHMVEQCDELMKYDDAYEVWKYLLYYSEEHNVTSELLTKNLKKQGLI